nr:type II toxin-antitoxin system RelE/ParE family toxin [Serratia liquefaciens]
MAHHPQAGRPVEDMAIEFREWPIDFGNSGYIIALYHFDGSTTVLLAVRHQSEAGN